MEETITVWLKKVKTNEDKISMLLGLVVIFLVAGMVFRYFNQVGSHHQPEVSVANTGQMPTATPQQYVVVAGDSLGRIAQDKYGDRRLWRKIAQANGINNPNHIEVGTKLLIPQLDKVPMVQPTTLPGAGSTNLSTSSIEGDRYIVKPGDQLWDIAVRAYGDGFRYAEIAKVNKLNNPDDLAVGLVLTLPR